MLYNKKVFIVPILAFFLMIVFVISIIFIDKYNANFNDSIDLQANTWKTVNSANNLLSEKLLIENINNDSLDVRIVNEKENLIGSEKKVASKSMIRMDDIPAFSGKYLLQIKSKKNGKYNLKVNSITIN